MHRPDLQKDHWPLPTALAFIAQAVCAALLITVAAGIPVTASGWALVMLPVAAVLTWPASPVPTALICSVAVLLALSPPPSGTAAVEGLLAVAVLLASDAKSAVAGFPRPWWRRRQRLLVRSAASCFAVFLASTVPVTPPWWAAFVAAGGMVAVVVLVAGPLLQTPERDAHGGQGRS